MASSFVVETEQGSKTLFLAFVCGVTPLFIGTVAFLWWWFLNGTGPILLGVGTIVVGTPLVLFGACLLFRAALTTPRPSRTRLVVAGLILGVNFPIAYAYNQLVSARVTTNRYVFHNESGAQIHDLAVFHRERQIGFCKTLESDASTAFYFSALNNGGEGPISFSALHGDGYAIGGDTGLMAFVFMKSHGLITLLPKGEYQVLAQDFTNGIATGDAELTRWPANESQD